MDKNYLKIKIEKATHTEDCFYINNLNDEIHGSVTKENGVTVFYPHENMCKDVPINLAAMEEIVDFMREFTLHRCFPKN